MIALTQVIGLEAVGIADALTATNIQLGVPQARGLIIPVSPSPSSLLSFYFRNDQHYPQAGGYTILDARAALQGSRLGWYGDEGAITGVTSRFFIDGFDVSGYGSNVIVANSAQTKWQRFDVRFENVAGTGGYVYLLMNDDGSGATAPLRLADVRRYLYTPSPGQLAQPLLPSDYDMRLTFDGYQLGDTFVPDVSGNGNHARVYA